jgi:pimeloyl-ACP methyl ester carboxylesterase
MLDCIFFSKSKAQVYYQDNNFNIWKFPATIESAKRQKRPIILNYSIMTRAYGTCCNKDSFIDYFNKHGFDVYLMDWGKDYPFTLSGWTLDMLADALNDKAVSPLLEEYKIDSLNVFGICIGGLITAHLINRGLKKDEDFAKKFHKIAFYGSPILGARDLGMARSFMNFYHSMKPYRRLLHKTGISLFALDMFLMQGISSALLDWTWHQFQEEGPKTFSEMQVLTTDDRWVPFAAFMDILEEAFASPNGKEKESFHFAGDVTNVHFFNLVGDSDLLVMPSASIVEWNSRIPKQFASFEQVIFPGGHFIFAQPGFKDVKEKLAIWFTEDNLKNRRVEK